MTVKEDKSGSFKATNHRFEGLHQRISKIGSRSIGSPPPASTHSWMSLTNGKFDGLSRSLSLSLSLSLCIYIYTYIYLYPSGYSYSVQYPPISKSSINCISWFLDVFPVLSMSGDVSLPRLIKTTSKDADGCVTHESHEMWIWWLLISMGTFENAPKTQNPTFLACTFSIL